MFAEHLNEVFLPNQIEASAMITSVEDTNYPSQIKLPDTLIKKCSMREVYAVISQLPQHKAFGYDLITAKVLRELPDEGFMFLTHLYNAVFRMGYVPPQLAQIIMIPKPGKNPEDIKAYGPISLLPIPSKIMKILFLKRIKPIIVEKKLIPDHQFGFRQKHKSTIEQVHRLVDNINNTLEQKKYCSAAFLDIAQAFDRVWHDGLLFKVNDTNQLLYFCGIVP